MDFGKKHLFHKRKARKKKYLLLLYAVTMLLLPGVAFCTENTLKEVYAQTAETVEIAGRTVSTLETSLDFNKCKISDYDTFSNTLALFPFLQHVELCDSNLSNEQMEALQNRYPAVKFVWKLRMKRWSLRTDTVAFSTNKDDNVDNLVSADVVQLKYCTDMVALDIGHNRVTDVSFLEYMPKLRVLILVDNRVADITPVAKCKDLVYIETFVNRITDMSPLANLVNLIDINISYNRFTDITPILGKPRVERLFVSHCGLSTEQLTRLQEEYPNAQIEYKVKESIDAGWRRNPRYKAMRTMYKTNTVSELFLTDVDRLAYYAAVFDAAYYAAKYPEVVAVTGTNPLDLLYYFLDEGIAAGQQASNMFSITAYKNNNLDLQQQFGEELNKYFMHYMSYGYKEGRICL